MENEELVELQLGAENLRRMFRQTMAHNARRPGESIEQTGARLARDPATAQVAKALGCSVRELLEGFGRAEVFHVDRRYDREAAERAVDRAIDRAAGATLGTNDPKLGDVLEHRRTAGERGNAPHIEAQRGRVLGDEAAKKQIALAFHKNISRRR